MHSWAKNRLLLAMLHLKNVSEFFASHLCYIMAMISFQTDQGGVPIFRYLGCEVKTWL